MKWIYFSIIFLLFGCNPQNEELSTNEIEQIKNAIIERSNKHAQDLKNLNYQEIMTFYADIDDHIVFGDGYYWGDYKTINDIWHDFTAGVKKVEKFDFFNHKVHVFSEDFASCLVEFYNERIGGSGDTTKGHGCFSYSLQKIDEDWKAVTTHVTHNYNVYDENGEVRKWWLHYSPENRKKEE